MKAICIGDPHFQVDNIPEVELFMERLFDYAKEVEPTFIVVLGDLLHTHERIHTTPLNKAYEFIDKLRKISKTFVLVGNHDMTSNQNFLNEQHWMNGMKEWTNVTIVDKAISENINDELFVFCPYVPPSRFEEALNTLNVDWTKARCIFAHQEFKGCKMGAIVSVDGDSWDLNYPLVISGHIHSKQQPQENIYYTGSSMQHAFGESEDNIIALITWTDEDYEITEKDLELPRKRIIYGEVQDFENYTLPETEDKLKITVSGVYEEFKAFKKTTKYKELIRSGAKVVFKPKKYTKKEKTDNEEKEENEEKGEKIEKTTPSTFKEILGELITKERNELLNEIHDAFSTTFSS